MTMEIVEIVTPQKYVLNGLWFGPSNPKRIFINVHGLTSTLFSGDKLYPLVDEVTSVLTFNNRGHDVVSRIKKLNPLNPKGYDSIVAGTTHEIFEDCVDDLEGAVEFCHKRGVNEVYLVGHSTGCQKSVFYLSKTTNKQKVSGTVLLCPLSDYAAVQLIADKGLYQKALAYARKQVEDGRPKALLSEKYWPSELIDAQRFLSLYTPESSEEIFTYSHNKKPITFQSVETPMLIVLAGSDEYADRSGNKLREWFDLNNRSKKYGSIVIENALHNLKEYEVTVCNEINKWTEK